MRVIFKGNIQQSKKKQTCMGPDQSQDEGPVDRAWAIHAAIIGLNTGNLLFRGLELDPQDPGIITVACLSLLAVALPFQAVFFLINSYIQDSPNVHEIEYRVLLRISLICQTVSYLSLIGIAILMFETHLYIGLSFTVGSIVAFFLVRSALTQVDILAKL
tara:strand:+ start:26861 stop:27340 length:480 start_codon:yes stop_codon:yes gene_type:complete